MKAYIICFFSTVILTYIAQFEFKNNKKKIGILFSILAIFIPSYIAGVRAVGVGRDIDNYVIPVINRATSAGSFLSFFNQTTYVEAGYRVYIYIITRFSNKLEVSLFFIQLIPITCVYFFAYKNREKLNMSFVVSIYLLLWYGRSLTIMRQSISIGLVLIGIIFFNENKRIKSMCMFILACLFHNSALMAFPILGIFYILDNKNMSSKQKMSICLIILIVISGLMFFYKEILDVLSSKVGSIFNKYNEYTNDSQFSKDDIITSYSEILHRLITIILSTFFFVWNNKRKENRDEEFFKYYILLIIEFILYIIVSLKMANGERVGYYFRYIGSLYCLTVFPKIFKRNMYNQLLIHLILVAYLFAFWYWKYPIQKNCETYPFRSDIITFLN